MIKAVRHTGVVVRDLEKAAEFYRALGFIDDNQAIEEGGFIDSVVGLRDAKVEWIKLKAPDGYLLELLQYHSHPIEKQIIKQKSNQLGYSHLAFSVDNIDIVCEKIEEIGGSMVNSPTLTNDKKVKVAYCHDNEGNLIEIVEVFK
ncbi:MAG: VOC family protein [Candidatus Endonucleobacter sp. (ex Gigantidas childressi)]|nr:VOC family protein [Candidatus Endonucleobacter sp. (ex Gigantidas childressi)]